MRYALMTEPQQGLSYDELLAVARAAEGAGFATFLRSDHFTSFPGGSGRPTTDAWATLAGLARETATIGLGALVSPVTFRLPGSFAKLVTTVDEMSGGRIEVGLGAGWNDVEHAQLGIPFPPLGERFDRLEEALAIIHGLWTEPDGWSYEGRFWQVQGSLYRPPAARGGRRHPHLMLGGDGKPRGLRLAATYGDEYNVSGITPAGAAEIREHLRSACVTALRDPDEVVFSVMAGVIVGETEREAQERVAQLLDSFQLDPTEASAWLETRRPRWIYGTPEQALEQVAAFAAVGVERLALQDFLPRDLAMVELLGRRVLAAS
ncbi:MAG: TIGR03560 family F420-dependent LLM class oxidoreductase [Candidatus Limnocylindrales bacterium]